MRDMTTFPQHPWQQNPVLRAVTKRVVCYSTPRGLGRRVEGKKCLLQRRAGKAAAERPGLVGIAASGR